MTSSRGGGGGGKEGGNGNMNMHRCQVATDPISGRRRRQKNLQGCKRGRATPLRGKKRAGIRPPKREHGQGCGGITKGTLAPPRPCDAAVQRASTPNGKDECAAKGTLGRPRQQPRMPGKDDGLTSYGLERLNRVSGPNFLVAPPLIARWAIASVAVAFHIVCGRAPPLAIQNLRRRFRDIEGG